MRKDSIQYNDKSEFTFISIHNKYKWNLNHRDKIQRLSKWTKINTHTFYVVSNLQDVNRDMQKFNKNEKNLTMKY